MPLDPSSWDPLALELSRRLDTHVRAEIAAAGGALPFDRFMDLALYAPGLGYYVAGAPKLGSGGDFVTAPEVSPLFGACLAAQCAEVLARLVGALGGGDILELGPGSGALASQVLGALAGLGALPGRYLLLEPSPDLAERQRARLHAEHAGLAGRCEWLSELPSGFCGIVLANEVLDAMPVHRFRIGNDARPQECFVTAEGGELGETWRPVRSPGLSEASRGPSGQRPRHGARLHLGGQPQGRTLARSDRRRAGGRPGPLDRLRLPRARLLPARPLHGHPDVPPAPPRPLRSLHPSRAPGHHRPC